MSDLDVQRRLVMVAGDGGAGKTTFAAALGVVRAERGARVLVLTADPARRLADALGVKGVSDDASQVELSSASKGGALYAAMLESRASFDELMRRIAGSRAPRILNNRVYRAFSRTLARSHAYAAIERIYAALHDDRYDLVIVDTPPAQSAMAIFDAPSRLARFLDQRVVRWFMQAKESAAVAGTGAVARNLLGLLAGESTVVALSEFLSDMAFLSDGFLERAQFLREYFCHDETGFVVVAGGDTASTSRAALLSDEFGERGYRVDLVVLNRLFVPEPGTSSPVRAPHDSDSAGDGGSASDIASDNGPDGNLIAALRRVRTDVHADNESRIQHAGEAMRRVPASVPVLTLPKTATPLADIDALSRWITGAVPLTR